MAAQAESRSITPGRKGSLLKRTADAAIAAFRQFVGPSALGEPGVAERTLIIPVADDGWSPAFRCGEFAIVDTSDAVPTEDGFFLRRGSSNNFNIVQLRPHKEEDGIIAGIKGPPEYIRDEFGKWHWDGLHWRIRFGAQIVRTLSGAAADIGFGAGGRIHMGDGPLADKYMRREIVGRVIGVLGQPGRALNWRDAP